MTAYHIKADAVVPALSRNPMSKKILHRGKFRHFVLEQGWEFVERASYGGIAVIIAVTEDQEIVFVEQYRVPVGRPVIEFPAGIANDQAHNLHETLEETARRELFEETGCKAKELIRVAEGPASSSTTSDILTIYYASGVKRIGKGGGDETENITVHVVPLNKVDGWLEDQIGQGKMIDLRIYAGLYYLLKQGIH
jgi:ADP-ribose pyrophosphatase